MNGDSVEVNDNSRFTFQRYDVVIMQLGDTGVGKSSICQALTNNLNFRIGTENGTTIVPRAGVIRSDTSAHIPVGEQLRQVLIDVPGLNQAVVAEERQLFVQHPGEPAKKLELEDIKDLIVRLAELMKVCLIVVDKKISKGFKQTYEDVLTLLITGVRKSDLEKYKATSDEDIRKIVKNRIVFVRNKADGIYDHRNPEEMIEQETKAIKQTLKLTNEPILFVVAGAHSARKGQGNFTKDTARRLNKPEFLEKIDELKKIINDKVHENARELIEQLEAENIRDRILKEAAKLGVARMQERHEPVAVIKTMLANVPNGLRCVYYNMRRKSWKIGMGIDNHVKRKVILHEHSLHMFLGSNKEDCYICQICKSVIDKGEYIQSWWYCKEENCQDPDKKWYVVHEQCAEAYEQACEDGSTENKNS